MYVIQHRRFPDVFSAIQKQQLGLKLDDVGTLRCYANATMNESTKRPKLLPRYQFAD